MVYIKAIREVQLESYCTLNSNATKSRCISRPILIRENDILTINTIIIDGESKDSNNNPKSIIEAYLYKASLLNTHKNNSIDITYYIDINDFESSLFCILINSETFKDNFDLIGNNIEFLKYLKEE